MVTFLDTRGYILIAILINLLVLSNSVIHHPIIGYDTTEHLRYVQVLLDRLPGPEQSAEFFSPPLPYYIPSAVYKICIQSSDDLTCRLTAGKVGQFINFFLSIAITWLLVKICEALYPGNSKFKLSTLLIFSTLTVYYKTFSQFRGEPYVAFFAMWVGYELLALIIKKEKYSLKSYFRLGILYGLLILSRQWGIFVFAGLGFIGLISIRDVKTALNIAYKLAITILVAFIVGGWFYLHLRQEYGSFSAFNRTSSGFSLSNQPLSFYRSTGLGDFLLFRTPTRPTFDNQLLPIFYTETWGDYWGYFVFIKDNSYFGELGYSNQAEINPYLGRVNLLSIFPSLLLSGGFLWGLFKIWQIIRGRRDAETVYWGTLTVIISFTLLGFLWFVISFPEMRKGSTIKPSYLIQIFMLLPIMVGLLLEKIRSYNSRIWGILLIGLGAVLLHNIPAMISKYTIFLK